MVVGSYARLYIHWKKKSYLYKGFAEFYII